MNISVKVTAKINQYEIENEINKIIEESGIDKSRINILVDEEYKNVDIMYDGNILISSFSLSDYIDIDLRMV